MKSEIGKGSEFIFELPLQRVKKPKIIKKSVFTSSNNYLKNKRILIVEDDDIIYEFLKIVLKPHEVKISRTINGKTAIQKYLDGKRFDLVLMDLGLPDMDGYSVTREILKISPSARIMAQSAYAMQMDIEKSYEAGCLDYISKPISTELLISKMSNLIAT